MQFGKENNQTYFFKSNFNLITFFSAVTNKIQLHVFTFIFSHLVIYIKTLLCKATNEDNGSNQNQQKSNNMQVLWQVSVSLTQYKLHVFVII